MTPTDLSAQSSLLEENLKKALTELMVLFLLSEKECYIGELTSMIHNRSQGALNIVFPYGAIYRLENAGFIKDIGKRNAPDGRRRQFYTITDEGKTNLNHLLSTYERFSKGVSDVLSKGENSQ